MTSTTGTDPAGSTSTSDAGTGPDPASSSSETTAASPTCGDAHLDPGEDCDLGAAKNHDTKGACTLSCTLPVCGDKLVWEGQEDCDHGEDNNDTLYGGCTTQCQYGDRCNDGVVQGPEECDLGAANGTGEFPLNGVPCGSGCRFQARIAFISSLGYKGGELGGVEGAHIKCQALAKQAKFDNAAEFMAWISDGQRSPLQDFDHGPETIGLPYVRPDGIRIADDWDDLILNGPGDGIIVTETGELLLNKGVWTGTAPSGEAFDPAATCKAWSSSKPVDQSLIGVSGVDKQQVQEWMQWATAKQWTLFKTAGCNFIHQIYCVEQ